LKVTDIPGMSTKAADVVEMAGGASTVAKLILVALQVPVTAGPGAPAWPGGTPL
jgi:hypothetical protein